MTSIPPTDERIAALLERRAASATTGGLLDEIVAEVERMPITPAPTSMVPWSAVVMAAAVLLAVALGLPRLGVGDDPTASPSPAEARPVVASGIDGPPLPAGRWRSTAYEPAVEFTVPAGIWTAGVDIPRQLWLRAHLPGAPVDEFDALTVLTVTNVYVDPCERGAEETQSWTDPNPDALLDWIEANTGQDLGPRRTVTVVGHRAVEVEFTARDPSECLDEFVPITDNGRLSPFSTSPAGQRVRYAVTTVDGFAVLIGTWTDDPARWGQVRAAADEVLASMEFVR